MKFIRLLKVATKIIAEWLVSAARGAARGLKKLLIIGLILGGLAFAVWWVIPDDWKIKYAVEYMVDTNQVVIEPKPHDCEWDTAPLGSKHCHYDRHEMRFDAKGNPAQSWNEGPNDKIIVMWEKVSE
jgi:hypothetical protein